MGLRLVNTPVVPRMAGYVAVAAVIIAAAFHFRQAGTGAQVPSHTTVQQRDFLAAALSHCQSIGMAAQDDEACANAWAENRRRFFTYRPTEYPLAEQLSDRTPKPKSEGQ